VEAANSLGCGLAAELTRRFGSLRLRATWGSMAPAVRPGEFGCDQSWRTEFQLDFVHNQLIGRPH
jgi:hypothetical protein